MLRLILAIWLGKLIFFISRLLNIGGGSAAPGYYSLKIEPKLVEKLAKAIPQNVVITGTNGKTTTARLLAHFCNPPAGGQKIRVIRNSTGSNLERGIASTLVSKANLFGQIKDTDLGIWELDEAVFNRVVFMLKPEIIVFLNAFRDQLDRYGEVDTVVKNWWETLEKVDWRPTIIVNSGDANTSYLKRITNEVNKNLQAFSFRVKDHILWRENSKPTKKDADLGEEFYANILENQGLKGTKIKLSYPAGYMNIDIPIPGIYHIYDVLAAFSVAYLLNLPVDNIEKTLKDFSPAFGRIERIRLGDKEGIVFLIKNPAGANSVFETITPELSEKDTLLIALNDNFADGKDVSWIWDANFEILTINNPPAGGQLPIICSGTRALDLAVRLKYAGFDVKQLVVEPDLTKALKISKEDLRGRLFIMPTYTALLELQKILANTGVKSHYWKETQ